MTNLRGGLLAAAALLLLIGCNGQSPGERPQEYMIDQDIDASHGADVPTSVNQQRHGFEPWRHSDPDTYGSSQGR